MLDKNQIQTIFTFEFKMSHKAVEITWNINKTFGLGAANEHTVQWWFKEFYRGDKSLEDEEHSDQSLEGDNDQLRPIVEADPLTTTEEVAEELSVNHSVIVQHLKQIGKVKKLIKWISHELTENQKNHWSVVFSYSAQKQWTISWSDCDIQWKVDSIGQLAMTRSVVQPSRSSKALPIAKLTPKMVMVIVWWSAAGQIHYSFLNSSESITSEKYAQQIDEMHWKLQWLQPALFNRKGPILLYNVWLLVAKPRLQKLNKLSYEVLPHMPCSQ